MEKFFLQARVDEDLAGKRLDQIAAQLFPDYSRARLQQWIREGVLLVDGHAAKAKQKLSGQEILSLSASEETQEHWLAEKMPLSIIHEDDALLVLNKPPGLVVHPAAGNRSGTMLNALLHHCPDLHKVPRAGIVHRLDKDTSGLLVVAKTLASHNSLVSMIQQREVTREYQAIVFGLVTAGGIINAPLGRHPKNRLKRAVVKEEDGKHAVTRYLVQSRFRAHTRLRVQLETGRTHQIRVHMAHIGYPLVGDQVYGGRLQLPKGASPALIGFLQGFKRQALHAWRLGFRHPETEQYLEWTLDIPEDMQTLIRMLEDDND